MEKECKNKGSPNNFPAKKERGIQARKKRNSPLPAEGNWIISKEEKENLEKIFDAPIVDNHIYSRVQVHFLMTFYNYKEEIPSLTIKEFYNYKKKWREEVFADP